MGKDGELKGRQPAQKTLQKHADTPLAAQAGAGGTSTEARFLAALQAMMGDVELTDESVRQAIAKMTPEQKQQLMQDAGGQQLKRELLTNEETKQDRSLYFKEVNRSAEAAGLPVDKDNSHLTKKVRHPQRRLAAAAVLPKCVRCPCLMGSSYELIACLMGSSYELIACLLGHHVADLELHVRLK